MAIGIGMMKGIAVMNIGMTEASIAGTFMIARKEEGGGVKRKEVVVAMISIVIAMSAGMTGTEDTDRLFPV
jgi:hypothetical protein